MQKIVPFLWFDTQAEEAARYYVSVFKNSKITGISHYTEGSPRPSGSVLTVSFELDGQEFTALNGGPEFKFNPAISFYVHCYTQAEVDDLWNKLTDGGEESMCGWLVDKFGVSWQIVPDQLITMLQDENPQKAARVMQAMLQMRKIEIDKLVAAYEQA
jgi:predicted 3-demethylubiquinone-9 3-methyltransferase (glyoxalase superfamily)